MPRPIILDTDPGQDDAIALLLALASPELDLLGITCVAGNVPDRHSGCFLSREACWWQALPCRKGGVHR